MLLITSKSNFSTGADTFLLYNLYGQLVLTVELGMLSTRCWINVYRNTHPSDYHHDHQKEGTEQRPKFRTILSDSEIQQRIKNRAAIMRSSVNRGKTLNEPWPRTSSTIHPSRKSIGERRIWVPHCIRLSHKTNLRGGNGAFRYSSKANRYRHSTGNTTGATGHRPASNYRHSTTRYPCRIVARLGAERLQEVKEEKV